MSQIEREAYFRMRNKDKDRTTLTADCLSDSCVAHIVIRDVDWRNGTVGNMGFRVHPDWCDKGVGTRVLNLVVAHFAMAGIARFRLDVAELNTRAIRCYEKTGFTQTKGFDRNGVHFLWMELEAN